MFIGIALLMAYTIAVGIKLGRTPSSLTELAMAFEWPLRSLWFVATWGFICLSAPSLINGANDNTRYLVYISLATAIIYTVAVQLNEEVDRKIATVAGWLCIVTALAAIVFNV